MKTVRSVLYLAVMLALLVPSLAGAAGPQAAKPHDPNSIIHMDEDWPTYIDPAVGNDFSDCIALVNLYDGLVRPKDDGSIAPALGTDWTVSTDNLTYTFHLRKDVKFHNGDMLKASDVVFSANRLLEIGQGFAYLFRSKDKAGTVTSGVKTITAPDDYTVQFTLARPFGPFVMALVRLYVVDEKQVMANIDKTDKTYGDKGDYGKKWLLVHDAGSGPYQAKEVKMEEYVMMEKFDDWYGGWEANAPDFFKEVASTNEVTIRTQFKNKEQEISDEYQTQEGFKSLKQLPGVTTAVYFGGHNLNIMLNNQRAPTDDIHFRKALSYIFDYDAATKDIWPNYKQSIGPVPHDLPGFNPNVFQFKRDVEKAKAELAQSKYANQLDKYPFALSWCAEVPEEEKLALLFQANASEIGVNVEVSKKPFGKMEDDAQTKETNPNGAIVYVAAHYAEAGSMLESRYHSKSSGTWENEEWLMMPSLDKEIDDALATADQTQRFAQYAKIQAEIADMAPTIWVGDQAMERAFQNYIVWPPAENVKAGKPVVPVMGYDIYAHDMKIFLDKKNAS
jgi:peptide/nickel transport system substrate-binding protein